MKNTGSNAQRRNALMDTINARLRHMATFMEEGRPADFHLPKTLLEFRNMNIPELGIFRISSPATLNAKQSPKLREKIDEIRAILDVAKSYRAKKKATKSLSETIRDLRRIKRKQAVTIAGLAGRYQQQESVIESLNRKLRIANDRNSLLTKELRELRSPKKPGALRIVDPDEP